MPRPPSDTDTEPGEPTGKTLTDPNHSARSAKSRRGTANRGDCVGRYVVVGRLGAGAMGVVYKAYDPDLDRGVALKLMRVDTDNPLGSRHEQGRLLREAQAMAKLAHPNVVGVYDVGTWDDDVFVAMEYIEGRTLRSWITPQTQRQAIVAAYIQAGRGLSAAHRAGLVHRDFKPDNVMIDRHDRVRVLDFGLARSVDTGQADVSFEHLRTGTAAEHTATHGSGAGTPAYMAPEQHLGEAATAASDQFSFCVALYEGLFGRRPFDGKNVAALAYRIINTDPPTPTDGAGVPERIQKAVLRGLSRDPEKRHPSMDDLLTQLAVAPGRNRQLVYSAAGIGGALAVGLMARTAASDGDATNLCDGANARAAQVWNPGRANSLAAAFEATRLGYATSAWDASKSAIDRWIGAWTQARTRACRATRVTGEQSERLMDLRIVCLDRQLHQLDTMLTAMAEPTMQVVTKAANAVDRLAANTRCDDTQTLLSQPQLSPDPEIADLVRTLESRLDEVQAKLRIGQYTAANAQLDGFRVQAIELDHAPLTADVLYVAAELEDNIGHPRSARETYEQAFASALGIHNDRQAAHIADALAHLLAFALGDAQRGRQWVGIARQLNLRLGVDPKFEAQLWTSEAVVEFAAGGYEAAIAAHQKALAFWEKQAPHSNSLAVALDDIGSIETARGNAAQALPLHERALAIRKELYGEQDPRVAASMREVGITLSHLNEHARALPFLERALESERANRGESNIKVATLLDDIGRIMRRQGNLDRSVDYHRRALKLWEQVLGDPHRDLAVSLLNVGYTLRASDQPREALAYFERGLKMFHATVGDKHAYIVYSQLAIAATLADLERFEDARATTESALALEGKVEADPTLFAEMRFIRAKAIWADGNVDAAARAQAMAEAKAGRDAYMSKQDQWAAEIAKIDAWLASRSH